MYNLYIRIPPPAIDPAAGKDYHTGGGTVNPMASVTGSSRVEYQPLFERPHRLSDTVHRLADEGLSGKRASEMQPTGFNVDEAANTQGMSRDMRVAQVVRLIAERAPLRILPGERICGSATLHEASLHRVPGANCSSVSHTTLGFARILKIGYRGLREEIHARRERGGLDDHGRDLLDAMEVCLDAAGHWHERYVKALEERVQAGGDEAAHWAEVLERLRPVPENPPETFGQAVQSLWFMWCFQRLCGQWSGIGRIDEMLGGFLERDLHEGRITLDDARDLLAHFWAKGTEWAASKDAFGGSGDAQYYQNIVLGGVDKNGREVTNGVTYLVLDVVEELAISDFPIAVRLNSKSPEKLLRRMAEVQRHGGGVVAAYNEDVVIPALCKFGYPVEEARTFANDGCWEAIIPGKTNFIYSPFDTLLLLQQALGLQEATAPEYASFEDLYAAFRKRLEAHLEEHNMAADGYSSDGAPAPLVSLFVEGCIEKGRGYYERGPMYTVLAPHAGGLADTANSLSAIRKLVYQQKSLTLPEMISLLREDWAGREDLRASVGRLDYYGNDNDAADAMVRRVFDDYTEIAAQVKERNGVQRPAGLSTFGREIEWRAHRLATASGRHKGDILATNFSPSPGTDRKGPTAALASYCKMDFTRLPNIGTIEMKVLPSSVTGEEGVQALAALLRGFVRLGGCFVHVDVVDSHMLRDAQKHPEKYPNLAVRVAGWSARFATLNHDWQEMVIARTQQVVHR